MDERRVFKLRLLGGVQTVRLDEDSLDYDWKGWRNKFHGTLPYENLRLKSRFSRKDRNFGPFAALAGLFLIWFVVSLPHNQTADVVSKLMEGVFIVLTSAFAHQLLYGGTICIQIDPRPFGFRDQFPLPDTKKGKAFLAELEQVWRESLRRRFLIQDDRWLHRIGWLEDIGVLTTEEAEVERARTNSEAGPERKMIGNLALN